MFSKYDLIRRKKLANKFANLPPAVQTPPRGSDMLKGTTTQPHSSWAWSVVRHTSLMVYTSLLLALNLFVVLSPSLMVQQIIHFYWLSTYLRCSPHLSCYKTLHFVKFLQKAFFIFSQISLSFQINSILSYATKLRNKKLRMIRLRFIES